MNNSYPRKGLFDTEERTLFCSTVGRDYHLSVALPESYATSNQAYPVLYLLDGDLLFGMAAGLTPTAHWCWGTPELIVVGISYDMESYEQWGQLRERDFKIPEVQDAPADSAANLFLQALMQEMVPFIEANYRTIPPIAACMAIHRAVSLYSMPCSINRMPFSAISPAAVIYRGCINKNLRFGRNCYVWMNSFA